MSVGLASSSLLALFVVPWISGLFRSSPPEVVTSVVQCECACAPAPCQETRVTASTVSAPLARPLRQTPAEKTSSWLLPLGGAFAAFFLGLGVREWAAICCRRAPVVLRVPADRRGERNRRPHSDFLLTLGDTDGY